MTLTCHGQYMVQIRQLKTKGAPTKDTIGINLGYPKK
jgi:hypothetical protein